MKEGELSPKHPEDVRVLSEGTPIVRDVRDNGGGGEEGSIVVGKGNWFAAGKEAGLSNLTI